MSIDLTPILAEYLAGNRGPDPTNPEHRKPNDYDVVATLNDEIIEIALSFLRGAAYCCEEWSCHLGLHGGTRWDNLRRRLAAAGINAPKRMELRGICTIEEGAIFFDFSKPDPNRRGWYEFQSAAGHHYEISAIEDTE